MNLSAEQRRMRALASMYGYKVSSMQESTVSVSEFSVGQGAIVLTMKGEPLMSGTVEEIRLDEVGDGSAIRVGNRWFEASHYAFRLL